MTRKKRVLDARKQHSQIELSVYGNLQTKETESQAYPR